jgi:hypothetical protein
MFSLPLQRKTTPNTTVSFKTFGDVLVMAEIKLIEADDVATRNTLPYQNTWLRGALKHTFMIKSETNHNQFPDCQQGYFFKGGFPDLNRWKKI